MKEGAKMKKRIVLFTLVCLVGFTILQGCSKKKEEPPKENTSSVVEVHQEQKEVIEKFAKDISSNNMSAIEKEYTYDTKMEKMMKDGSLIKQLSPMSSQVGNIKEMKEPHGVGNEQFVTVSLPVIFDKQQLNIVLSFNSKQEIQGIFFQPYLEKENTKTTALPDRIIEEDLALPIQNGTKTLAGKLTMPKEGNAFPVVILVAGSGPNDMDETIVGNKPFRDIAWELATQGIASYRYDKRTLTYGKEFNQSDTIDDEVSDDVLAAIAMMKENKRMDPEKLFVLGHSLGGYILPRIANTTNDVAGYVLMAAPTLHLEDMMVEQVTYLANLDKQVSKKEQASIDQYKADQILAKQPEKLKDEQSLFGSLSKAYLLDLKDYDPITSAKTIKQPVLVVQGERDYQVTMEDFNAWKKAFEGNKNWIFKSYAKLNHLMMEGNGPANPEEYATKSTVSADVLKDIIQFIKEK